MHRTTLALLAALLFSPLALTQSPLGGTLPDFDRIGRSPQNALAIEVHDSGLVSIGGVPLLTKQLAERAAAGKDGDVLIRAHHGLPAQAVAAVIDTCARAGASRVWLGAVHPSETEGAFAMFLASGETGHSGEVLPLQVSTDGQASSMQELTRTLERYLAAMGDDRRAQAVVDLAVPGDLAWTWVVPMLGAVHGANVPFCRLRVVPTAEQTEAWRARDVRGLVEATEVVHDQPSMALGPVRIGARQTSGKPQLLSSEPMGFTATELPVLDADVGALAALGGDPSEKKVPIAASQAMDRGVAWLAQNQTEEGFWPAARLGGGEQMEVGATGLALLALLANGNTMADGPYAVQVRRAVAWLADQQQENGLVGRPIRHDFIYGHAIATWALVEASGLSGRVQESDRVREAAQNGLDYLELHRNPYLVWRYQPRDNDNDTSVTTWCVAALCAAKSFDFEINAQALKLAEIWYDQVADPVTGRHGYTQRGELSSRHRGDHAVRFPAEKNEAMTGAALAARYFLGQTPEKHSIITMAAALVASKPPRWDEETGAIDFYAWFWGTMGLYQSGGRHWREWEPLVRRALLEGQNREGATSGSWEPLGVWCADGGRVYSTAMALMTLQTVYRSSRLVR